MDSAFFARRAGKQEAKAGSSRTQVVDLGRSDPALASQVSYSLNS